QAFAGGVAEPPPRGVRPTLCLASPRSSLASARVDSGGKRRNARKIPRALPEQGRRPMPCGLRVVAIEERQDRRPAKWRFSRLRQEVGSPFLSNSPRVVAAK